MSERAIQVPTLDEIRARFDARKPNDMFGFEIEEYLECLDYDRVKEFLKEGVTPDQWNPPTDIRAWALGQMLDYMEFAWYKANGERGISANRSVMHYLAWTWLAGDREFNQQLEESYDHHYCDYGKPQLKMICEYYGWDWKQWA